jgi:hypothetical protein
VPQGLERIVPYRLDAVAAVSTMIECDLGDVGWDGREEGRMMSVIRHAAGFKRFGIREGKADVAECAQAGVVTATLKENILYSNVNCAVCCHDMIVRGVGISLSVSYVTRQAT